jgi:hypothetical protein
MGLAWGDLSETRNPESTNCETSWANTPRSPYRFVTTFNGYRRKRLAWKVNETVHWLGTTHRTYLGSCQRNVNNLHLWNSSKVLALSRFPCLLSGFRKELDQLIGEEARLRTGARKCGAGFGDP